MLGRGMPVVRRQAREVDPVPQGRGEHLAVVEGAPEAADHLHAGVDLLDRQPLVEPRPADRHEIALAPSIVAAHAAEMLGKEALADEVGERHWMRSGGYWPVMLTAVLKPSTSFAGTTM